MDKALEPAEAAEETRSPLNYWSRLFWITLCSLLFYIFSIGPVVMLADHGLFGSSSFYTIGKIYVPLETAYMATPLHKPLGLYLHLWSKRFDNNGDPKH